jgi:PAS domain S-box-containing protein
MSKSGGKAGVRNDEFKAVKENGGRPRIMTDESGGVLDANDKFLLTSGFTLEELKSMQFSDLISPDDHPKLREHYQCLRGEGKSSVSVRFVTRGRFVVHALLLSDVVAPGKYRTILSDQVGEDRRERELQYRNRCMLALYEIGKQMTSSLDVDKVLKLIVKNIAWLLECHFVGIALLDAENKDISYREAIGNKSDIIFSQKFDVGQGIPGRVIATNKPFVLNNFPADPVVNPDEFPVVVAENLKSVLGVPLTNKGRQFGAIVLGYRRYHAFTEEEVQLVVNLANQAALALENVRLYQESVVYARSMAALTSRLTVIQEEERRRITRDLHDGVGQALTGLRLHIDILTRQAHLTDSSALDRVAVMKQIIDETLNTISQIAFDLRPPILDDFGLVSALRVYVDRFAERARIDVGLNAPENLKRFDPKAEATLYRVIQESLTNIAKHSHATKAQIDIERTGDILLLTISDNGKGFDNNRSSNPSLWNGGLGVVNMKERIDGLRGSFTLTTERGKGTNIRIEIPLNER